MKKSTLFSVCVLLIGLSAIGPAAATVPDLLPLQGLLTDAEGQPLDGMHNMSFAIYGTQSGGEPLWTEARAFANAVEVDNGLVTVYLGEVTTLDFTSLVAEPELWLGITVDTDAEMSRVRIAAMPFAHEAERCSVLGDLMPEDLQPRLSTSCGDGMFVRGFDSATNAPLCGEDLNDQLTETQVDAMVANNDFATVTWVSAQGYASELWIAEQGFAIESDLSPVAASGSFADLETVPAGLADGDDDLLSELGITCDEGAVVSFAGGQFSCTTTAAIDITGSAAHADDATLLAGRPDSDFQLRVSGGCGPTGISEVRSDGSVTCVPGAPLVPKANTLSTVDSEGWVGWYPSVTIGADGLPLITYTEASNYTLKVAHCADLSCSSAALAVLDTLGAGGSISSITVGTDGLGLISYSAYGRLKVAHCNDMACSTATLSAIEGNNGTGQYNSVAIGTDGLGLIAYNDNVNSTVKAAHCDDVVCTSATTTTIDTPTGYALGSHVSLSIGADGMGIMSYGEANSYLRVAHCDNVACTTATSTRIDGAQHCGDQGSLAIGMDGLAIISYRNSSNADLKVAHCSNALCTEAVLTTIDSVGSVGTSTSITIGTDGLPIISYHDVTNADLKVAHCTNTACTAATIVAIDNVDDMGRYTSITIGTDGLPIIGYYDATGINLKLARCANPFCVPYFRRR